LSSCVEVVAFIELCRGVEILSARECGLLSMSNCVVLTVLEKVSIIEFAYLARNFCLPQHMTISRLHRVGGVVGLYCLKISEDCYICLFGKGRCVCRVVLR